MTKENENKRTALLDELVKEINRYIELRRSGNEAELAKCEETIKRLTKDFRIHENGIE
jgi:hypothetical protein